MKALSSSRCINSPHPLTGRGSPRRNQGGSQVRVTALPPLSVTSLSFSPPLPLSSSLLPLRLLSCPCSVPGKARASCVVAPTLQGVLITEEYFYRWFYKYQYRFLAQITKKKAKRRSAQPDLPLSYQESASKTKHTHTHTHPHKKKSFSVIFFPSFFKTAFMIVDSLSGLGRVAACKED